MVTPCWWTEAEGQNSLVQLVALSLIPRSKSSVRDRVQGRAPGVERAETDELGVSTHTDAADPTPSPLEDLGEDDELHVLHPGEQGTEAVVDAHPHLDGTDLLRGEGLADLADGVGVEPAVGVHHSDDHSRGGHCGAAGAHDRQRVVERLPLAQTGMGRPAADHLDALVPGLGGRLSGVVVGAVIDDHDAQPRVRDRGESPDTGTDHLRLVEAGHEDDDEKWRVRVRGSAVTRGARETSSMKSV